LTMLEGHWEERLACEQSLFGSFKWFR